jgi:hypothetical protein
MRKLKILALGASMIALTASGAFAAADSESARGDAPKHGTAAGMKAEGDMKARGDARLKVDSDRNSRVSSDEKMKSRELTTRSRTRFSYNNSGPDWRVRTHRYSYSYNSGPSVYVGSHRHYVYNDEPDTYVAHKHRHHRHYGVYGYYEPGASVSIYSSRHHYGSGGYVSSSRYRTGGTYARSETSIKSGSVKHHSASVTERQKIRGNAHADNNGAGKAEAKMGADRRAGAQAKVNGAGQTKDNKQGS